jgi:hypothetical protein
MTTARDYLVCIVLAAWAMLAVYEAEGAEPPTEPRCSQPVTLWPMDVPERTCGEWRCLTRSAWAEQVMAPERELTLCADNLRASSRYSASLEEAHRAAVKQSVHDRQAVDRMRRRRWQYVAAGAVGGVLLSAGVVYAGVQVVGAR